MFDHPNVSLVRKVGAAVVKGDLSAAEQSLSPDVVWHYFNPGLPELSGDHAGLSQIKALFGRLAEQSEGTFTIEPVSTKHVGDELVVTHVRPKLELKGRKIETDAVVVWRIEDHKIAEVWDIPAVDTASIKPSETAH